mgnify:CR=1 FL=1
MPAIKPQLEPSSSEVAIGDVTLTSNVVVVVVVVVVEHKSAYETTINE